MVSASEFVDGADVAWRRLGRTLVGGAFAAVFAGWASLVLGISDVVIGVLEWFAEFGGRFVETMVGYPELIALTWDGAADFIEGTGPLGFVLAISLSLLATYVAVRVVRLA